jgi:SAM-dependent methyltransferase
VDHSIYDKRRYPIVDVREGYGEWARTYERTVEDEMDLRLLGRVRTIDWAASRSVLDLACGTGRVGAWLRRQGCAAALDGIDLTPAMLDVARGRAIYRTLGVGDVTATGLPPEAYDRAPGESVTIRSYVHLLSDHVKAAHAAGWSLVEMDEGLVDEAWLRKKPKWELYRGLAISFSMVWRRGRFSGRATT